MLLLVISVIVIVLGIIMAIYSYKHRKLVDVEEYGKKWQEENWDKSWLYVVYIAFIAIIVIGALLYFPNLAQKGYLQSFYDSNATAYQTATTKTATYLSTDQFTKQLIAGSIEKEGLTNNISDRIADWRNAVVAYNQQLLTYQIMKSNIWIGLLMPSISGELKPLEIQ